MIKIREKKILAIGLAMILSIGNVVYAYAFTDVKAGAWYYDYVTFLEKSGISGGYPDGTYRPNHTVSSAECLVLMMKTLKIPVTSSAVPAGQHWSYHYTQAASAKKAVTSDFSADQSIKRGQAATILYALLGTEPGQSPVSPFADTNDTAVIKLYQLGIFSGFSENGALYFKPENKLTRAELSVIAKKLYDYQEGTAQDFVLSPVLKDSEALLVQYPKTVADFEKILLYMAKNNLYQITIPYTTNHTNSIKDGTFKNNAMAAFNNVFVHYPEYCSYTNEMSVSGSYGSVNRMILEVESDHFSANTITTMRDAFFKEAQGYVGKLVETGKITSAMTDTEKAKVLYEWVAHNLKYDETQQETSFTGYGASHYKTAVCQGYTALYNAMCKMVGIQVQGIAGTATGNNAGSEGHIWTLAVLDGKRVHIDVTYGDPVPDRANYCSFDYFAVSSDFISKNHTWDKAKYGI